MDAVLLQVQRKPEYFIYTTINTCTVAGPEATAWLSISNACVDKKKNDTLYAVAFACRLS